MFHYHVHFFDEEREEEPLVKESGILKANTYMEAMERALQWFGENRIVSIEFYELDDVLDYAALEEIIRGE